ncbi:OLC1v1012091C1 [Oldenlandia corymbosa var. corymbosa]|uniref:OLC1v1012091C1 n=1 Tax=Oldenlandia corymbosa var. corymbosa TaxID=529605 RepID=A0AAV1DV69_OLDCO|nr:OLC1v1012091C1 [Oldenlandia corymbosa var. corymbosa]
MQTSDEVHVQVQPSSSRSELVVYLKRDQEEVDEGGLRVNYPSCHFPTLPRTFLEKGGEESRGSKGSFYNMAIHKGFLLIGWLVTITEPYAEYPMYNGAFYISSAITHQWFSLPDPPPNTSLTERSVGFITQVDEARKILTSYKVVLLNPTSKGTFIEADILSSETKRWEHIKVKLQCPITMILTPLVLNNTLYWVSNEWLDKRRFGGNAYSGILAYDPYESPNHFQLIELPCNDFNPKRVGFDSNRGVCQGRLKYFRQ